MAPLLLLAAAAALPNSTKRMTLPLRDVNLLVTTDIHAWLHGHRHADNSPVADGDLGDLVSFLAHVRAAATEQQRDVFLFDNGDVNDGTGFDKGSIADALLPLLAKVPYDALNAGNHELYEKKDIDDLRDSFIPDWNGRYLTSNTRLVGSGNHLGSPFAVVKGKFGTKLLVFGFVYTMPDADRDAVEVEDPKAVVEQKWFLDAVAANTDVDAVVVLGHMSAGDSLVNAVVQSIRSMLPTTPVQFLAGHSHRRTWRKVDDRAAVLESGSNLLCVGYTSFNKKDPWFEYQYVDWNLEALYDVTGLRADTWDTQAGKILRREVKDAQEKLGLLEVLGCQNRAAVLSRSAGLNDENALWGLYLKHTIPEGLFKPARNSSQWFISQTGSLRYDLASGGGLG
eukprot:TRINITY_DN4545_c0_g1_i1.p1 TRINITY_DN4545_c0_g1~~TRINITY_DN4545_c0_g1_i1.p1  ORF type:complete len:413 (+),score=126.61 TRINITY_DN4545_c0_g1_i1:53-1240(+)